MFGKVLTWLTSGALDKILGQLNEAYKRKLEAENDKDKLAAELDIQRLHTAAEFAQIANQDRWSATSLGRYLIVLPFGIWFALIFFVSIVNPLFGWNLVILDIPSRIWEISLWLVPVIIAGEVWPKTRLFKR